MNIVVCVKQVPDTWAEKKLDPTDRTLDRSSGDQVINELDEYAVEEALRLKEARDGSDEVTVLTMGPAGAADALKKGLQMGADKGVHLVDDRLHGSDALATSYALAEVLRTLSPDLVLFGSSPPMPGCRSRRWSQSALTCRRSRSRTRSRSTATPSVSSVRRMRVRPTRGVAVRRRQRRREDQRAALPVVQGDHGREEEAAVDSQPR